ncbi:hypothetical protein DFJ74DRAFT_684440 [Hyaloraphidium curvatum]|nr:hypothetical protein DFJ74DRAFT_684440 [Hyaloraphidium curvatum]
MEGEAGPSDAPAPQDRIVYTKSLLSLADLQFSDENTRTLVQPLPVRSKKQISWVIALGRFHRGQEGAEPVGFKSSYRYFDWTDPTSEKGASYVTTVLDGSYKIRAATAPQNKMIFDGKTATGAWVALTRQINNNMPEDKVKRRENLAFRDFMGLNSEVLQYLFAQMKSEDLGLPLPAPPPPAAIPPPHLDNTLTEEGAGFNTDDEKGPGSGAKVYRYKAKTKKNKDEFAGLLDEFAAEGKKKKRRKKADKDAADEEVEVEQEAPGPKPAKPKVLLSDPSIRPRKWQTRPLHFKTISGSSIVVAGWFSSERPQVARAKAAAAAAAYAALAGTPVPDDL